MVYLYRLLECSHRLATVLHYLYNQKTFVSYCYAQPQSPVLEFLLNTVQHNFMTYRQPQTPNKEIMKCHTPNTMVITTTLTHATQRAMRRSRGLMSIAFVAPRD